MVIDVRLRLRRFAVAVCFVLALLSAPTHAQDDEVEDALDSVPIHLRGRLLERVKEFVEYGRAGQWDKAFEMLSPAYRDIMQDENGRRPTKEEWVEAQKRWHAKGSNRRLMGFRIERGVSVSDSWEQGFYLEGCGEYGDPGKKIKSRVYASWESGEWFFSDIEMIFGCVTCPPEECVESQRKLTPNNGMHPTADTTVLKFLQRCGAAGDAGR